MARIRVARGSKTNLPAALDENTLLYGEMYWEKEESGVSDGVLYMGKPDSVADGVNDKDPLAIAGARAMKSLYFQGLWDPSGGAYPANPSVGDIYVASADGAGAAATFRYGDWAVCISADGETSQWLKAINQAITTEDPLKNERNPLALNEGVLKLKYDPATLKINDAGELTVSHTEVYTVETSNTVIEGQPIALDSSGKAIVADFMSEDTAVVVGVAQADAAEGEFVIVQRSDLVKSSNLSFTELGAPVYLYVNGSYTQDVEQISPGYILQQVGIATGIDTIDVSIGTPFQIDASSDIYYIPLTQTIDANDEVHAPSSKAVYDIVQQLTNVDTQLVSKTDTGTQQIAGSLELAGDITARDAFFSSNSVYVGDAKLSAENGALRIVNTTLPEQDQIAIDVITDEELLALDQDIIPDAANTRSLGSAEKTFAAVYADEVFVGASSLYVNGKKVIEDNSDTIEFKTDTDQAVAMKTIASVAGAGNANLVFEAGNEVNVLGYGGMEFLIPATASGKNMTFTNNSSGGEIVFTTNVAIGGDLTISGDITQINTTQVNISDNLIQVNSDQEGVPATTLIGGIEINRGDETNYRFVFEELTDTFRIGEQGSLQAVATREDTMANNSIPFWNNTVKQFQDSAATISGSQITGSLNGNAATASKLATAAQIKLIGDVTGQINFDGSTNVEITTVVGNNSHTHTSANISDATNASTANTIVKRDASGNFSAGTITANLTGSVSGGQVNATNRIICGDGSGSVALTTNDGQGNANVTFNHVAGVPDFSGNSARIEVNTDAASGASMIFEVGSGVTADTAVSLNTILTLTESGSTFTGAVTAPTFNGALVGNAATATQASKVTVNANDSSTTAFPVVWHNNSNVLYDTAGVFTFKPSTGELTATKVYNAVWNDIADLIEVPSHTEIAYGRAYVMTEAGEYQPSTKYMESGIMGICSDTYGYGLGIKEGKKQLPIAIGGFVLAHVDKVYKTGTPLTATEGGFLTEIKLEDKRDYPERIIATFWKPEYDSEWNGIAVNNRQWVKVK